MADGAKPAVKRIPWLWVIPSALAGVALTVAGMVFVPRAVDEAVTYYRQVVALRSVGRGQLPLSVLHRIRRSPVPVVDALALCYAESRGRAWVVSSDGGLGLFQVSSNVAKLYHYTRRDMMDPLKNTDAGLRHFQASLVVWRSNQTNAICGWNCGVQGWREQLNAHRVPVATQRLLSRYAEARWRLGVWVRDGRQVME
jgi:soluble lytic murein transglycosylase-like protein